METFDVVVIGGGHAGCEAAHASARMGCLTALITLDQSRIASMSCNPAIGGLAKGQLVKEIDALGGIMGVITDRSAIQYRRLNSSKGPAVRSSRAQCDRAAYSQNMQNYLSNIKNLAIFSGEVSEILTLDRAVSRVVLGDGAQIGCRAVIVTSGTFLRGMMFTGNEQTAGGRWGDPAAVGLSKSLENLGFRLGRLKTGTPPRLHKKSIDYSQLEKQTGDANPLAFSFYQKPNPFPFLPQVSCHISYTNEKTHRIIEENFSRSTPFGATTSGALTSRNLPISDFVKLLTVTIASAFLTAYLIACR